MALLPFEELIKIDVRPFCETRKAKDDNGNVVDVPYLNWAKCVPLIHGLPISNLSDGELLELCVDITVSKPGQLQIILIDGAERLDKESRDKLYAKCKAKGLQLIATRVTDSDVLEVTEL